MEEKVIDDARGARTELNRLCPFRKTFPMLNMRIEVKVVEVTVTVVTVTVTVTVTVVTASCSNELLLSLLKK